MSKSKGGQEQFPNVDNYYQITSQEFSTPQGKAHLAIKSHLEIRSVHSGGSSLCICETQLEKKAEDFTVLNTDCRYQ